MAGPFDNGGLGIQTIPGVAGEGPNMTGTNLGVSELMQMLRGLTSDPSRLIQNQSVIPQGGLQPLPKRIYPEMQQSSNREFTTSGGHKRASMMDLGSNIASMIKAANQNLENKKARDLSVDIERVMIAAQNPNDPQNQQVLKDIMSDPRKVKSLSEALNINLMGEEDKRKPHQRQAVAMATQKLSRQQQKEQQQQQFQQGSEGRVQQLLKSLPNAPELSPYANAVAQLTKLGVLPKGTDIIKAATMLNSTEVKAKLGMLMANRMITAAQVRAYAQVASSYNYAQSRAYVEQLNAYARMADSNNRFNAAMARTKAIEEKINSLKGTQDKRVQDTLKQLKGVQDQISKTYAEYQKNTSGGVAAFMGTADSKDKQALKDRLNDLYQQEKQLTNLVNQLRAQGVDIGIAGVNAYANTGDAGSGAGDASGNAGFSEGGANFQPPEGSSPDETEQYFIDNIKNATNGIDQDTQDYLKGSD